ncbi:hypothetical protein Ddc_18513 [Ditylenchus destructor]|nr:hypothetical protein Ddc_18513 [Ditylenchus destructor]
MSLPSDIFYNVTNFLPNDDIADLMLLSKTFNVFVTPRLRKIDQEMAITNQSIKSFMPSPTPKRNDNKWVSQLNLKKFEPIDSVAKKAMKEVFFNDDDFKYLVSNTMGITLHTFDQFKESLSLERFDDPTSLRILGALLATPNFRQEYNVPHKHAYKFVQWLNLLHHDDSFDDEEWSPVRTKICLKWCQNKKKTAAMPRSKHLGGASRPNVGFP